LAEAIHGIHRVYHFPGETDSLDYANARQEEEAEEA
jgi:hypothetical protein